MEFIKKLLGINKLEKEITQNKNQIDKLKKLNEPNKTYQNQILKILKTPTSTTQLAKKLKIGRSRTSQILNKLETQNKIYEHSKSKRTILYKTR